MEEFDTANICIYGPNVVERTTRSDDTKNGIFLRFSVCYNASL